MDPRNGGSTDGLPSWPDTLEARTGGGGQHIIFTVPEGAVVPGKLDKGLDLKRRGYIVIEPSIHPSGGVYQWLDWAPEAGPPRVAPAPQWLLDPRGQTSDPAGRGERSTRLDIARAVKEILHAERYHDNLIALAAHFIAARMPSNDAVHALRGLMDTVHPKDARWKDRYDSIPKAVKSAADKFARDQDVVARSDDAIALSYVERYQESMRWTPGMDWMINAGSIWRRDEILVRYDRARTLCREAAVAADAGEARRLASSKTVNAVVSLAQSVSKTSHFRPSYGLET